MRVRPRYEYEWLWGYGFVGPATGQTAWLLPPHVSTELFDLALAHFARAVGAGPHKRVLLVLDQAGWHTTGRLVVRVGIDLVYLPAHSPELQPAERLWPLCSEGLANKLCATMAELEEALAHRLAQIKDQAVRRLTHYHWWRQER